MPTKKLIFPIKGAASGNITPAAPTQGTVNDTLNTFDWTNSSGYTALGDYEYTLNGGSTYTTVTAKPIDIGNVAKSIGQVGVRVKAATGRNASATLFNASAFTVAALPTPATPTAPVTDDTANTFNWTNSSGYTALSDYEYTLNAGSSYQVVTAKPIVVGDVNLSAGQVGVRVKAVTNVNNASGTLFNTVAFTGSVSMTTPATPTNPITDDTNNTFNWTFSGGYNNISFYEYTLNGGTTYQDVTVKPIVVGNVQKATGQVGVRVKAGVTNYASATLFNDMDFQVDNTGGGAGGTISASAFRSGVTNTGGTLSSSQITNIDTFIDQINYVTNSPQYIYPYVGGTLDSCVLEIDFIPQSLVPVGAGWNFDAVGATKINSTSFFNTGVTGSAFDLMNFTMAIYSNMEVLDSENGVDMGVAGPPAGSQAWISAKILGLSEARVGNLVMRTSNAIGTGCFILTVVEGAASFYKDNVLIGSGTVTSGTFTAAPTVAIGGINYEGSGYIAPTSRKRICDVILPIGLNEIQVSQLSSAITTFATNKV